MTRCFHLTEVHRATMIDIDGLNNSPKKEKEGAIMFLKVGQVNITNIDLNTTLHHIPPSVSNSAVISACYVESPSYNITVKAHNHPP